MVWFFGKKKQKEETEELNWGDHTADRRQTTFLPCPGLSHDDLMAAREQYKDFFEKEGQKPKEKIKFTFKEKEQIDYIREVTSKNVWYYKDRLMVARGPCNLHVLRDCWTNGIIDENTLVWGQGLAEWLPARNVRTLVPQIRTVEDVKCLKRAIMLYLCPHPDRCFAPKECSDEGLTSIAVQLATWIKRNLALKPALKRIRKQRAAHRNFETEQVDRMF